MERYKNSAGGSHVHAYEVGADSIIVQFKDGSTYLYDYGSTGSKDVEQMKRLARRGSGLNTFIGATVKKRYAKRLRAPGAQLFGVNALAEASARGTPPRKK